MEGGRWSRHKIKEEVIIRSQGPKSFKSISGLNSKRLSGGLQWAEAVGFLCWNQSFGKVATVCVAGFSTSPVEGPVPSEQIRPFQDGLSGGGLGLFLYIRQKPSALLRNEWTNEWMGT